MKNATPDQESSVLNCKDTSAQTQRVQIIALLNVRSMNTVELRAMGIMSPAARIMELKKLGHNIRSVRETYFDEHGKSHVGVSRYYLANNPPAGWTKAGEAA